MAVADRVSVDYFLLGHILSYFLCFILVNPIWKGPVLWRDQAIIGFAGYKGAGDSFKGRIEGLLVQEHPVISVLSIETIFNLAYRLGYVPDIAVPRKGDKCSVHA